MMSISASPVLTPMLSPFVSATPNFVSGTDTPRDFLERRLARLSEVEPAIGAFVNLNIDGAREAADRSTQRWRAGRPLSSIDGMPVGIKDIIETVDMPTEMGSPLFAGWRSGRDAASVVALREAGAVVLGKTVTTEFAASEPRGTRNPWDLKRTPGGSSSGSAAAVAAGILTAALGTQVVGSIVRPASFCGCVGFKPTLGAINRGGSHDYLSQSCTGVLAATLDDAWHVAWEIATRAGGDPGFPGLVGLAETPAPKKPRAVAMLQTAGWPIASDSAKLELERAVARIRSQGVQILDRGTDNSLSEIETAVSGAFDLTMRINAWESRWPLNTYREKDRAALSQRMLERLATAEAMSLEAYRRLLLERARIRALYAKLATVAEAALTLAAPGPAPEGLHSTGNPVFAVPASLLGVPAISLPLLRAEGLPLGLQVIGFEQFDAALFAVAAWLRDLLGSDRL